MGRMAALQRIHGRNMCNKVNFVVKIFYETGSVQDSKAVAGAYVAHNAEMPICQGTEYKLGFSFTISRIKIDFICRQTQNALLQCNDLKRKKSILY